MTSQMGVSSRDFMGSIEVGPQYLRKNEDLLESLSMVSFEPQVDMQMLSGEIACFTKSLCGSFTEI